MPSPTSEPTTAIEKKDRCADLSHRPRVLLGKMGLDGHDRGVKLIARALRDSGIHVIYSGLWQTPRSLAISARDEDVDCIASSMMSNSHLVLVPRLIEECARVGRPDMIVNVGGIIPQEDVQPLLDSGVHRIFHTGASMDQIIDSVREATKPYEPLMSDHPIAVLARQISMVHASPSPSGGGVRPALRSATQAREAEGEGGAEPQRAADAKAVQRATQTQRRAGTPSPQPSPSGRGSPRKRPAQVIGITGSPGAGKSTLTAAMAAEMVRRGQKLAVVAFDPMSPITSGALLGDRLRVDFNTIDENVFYRSLAIVGEDYSTLPAITDLIGGAGFDTLIIETVGAGQNDVAIRNFVDRTAVVVVPGMGDSVQMDKAGILEIADVFVVNKADFPGENKLVRELRDIAAKRPIFETIATQGKGVVELLDGLVGSM